MQETPGSEAISDIHPGAMRLAIGFLFGLGLGAVAIAGVLRGTSRGAAAMVVFGAGVAAVMWYLDSKSFDSLITTFAGVLMLWWFVSTPVLSFWFRIPVDRSIITYDRAVFAFVLALLFLRRIRSRASDRQFKVTRFEIAWALLCLAAMFSVIAKSSNIGYATRIAIDSFALPLAAFHLARNHFDARRYGKPLVWALLALMFFLFATGAYEYISGLNLFQYKGSELIREGEYRVNGPFASDSSFAIISLILALFLSAAPKILNVRLDTGARLLHALAFAAGLGASLLPLFRIVAAALVISWFVLEAGSTRFHRRANSPEKDLRTRDDPAPLSNPIRAREGRALWVTAVRVVMAAALIVLVLVKWDSISGAASAEQRLVSPNSVYGRLATWEAALTIAANHPLAGVGLSNYTDAFNDEYEEKSRWLEPDLELVVADTPHSNALWIASELGVSGLIPYAAANFLLLLMGGRALRAATNVRARASAACFVALVLAYSIPGIALSSGVYSDLNLYFFFVLGLLSRRMQNQPPSTVPA